MSDSEHSTVTYTSVSEDDSDIGSPGVDGPPIMPEDPYAYIMAAYGAKEQPLHAATSPTAESPGYIPESDPEEDPEEDPADYPADRDDDDDDEEEEEHPANGRLFHLLGRGREGGGNSALNHPTTINTYPLSSPLPQIPSPTPNSPTHIEIPESCLPLRKRVRFASPTPSREVGESSAAGAARQDRPTISRDDPYSIAREDLYGFVDMG
ncbi:hypothetical protein Tco_1246155 [Tanacetum coccineum]